MSYEILYNKQFVKLPKTNKIIPMILAGSNNCYEAYRRGRGRERRERSWFCLSYYNENKRVITSPDVLLLNVIKEKEAKVAEVESPDYWDKKSGATKETVEKNYGYYNSLAISGHRTVGTTFDNYYSFFKNGIKNALTIEQLKELGIKLYFTCYNNYKEFSIPVPTVSMIEDENSFYSELAKWEEFEKNTTYKDTNGKDVHTSYYLEFNGSYEYVEDKLKRYRSNNSNRNKKEKVAVKLEHSFVLQNNQGYLIKYSSRGYKYSYYLTYQNKQFETEKKAESFRLKLIKNQKHMCETWKVTKIEQPTVIYK